VNNQREHLDAETIAAWIDGGLDTASLAAAEAHASNCDRCQALLATVARTLPAEDVVGETRSALSFWKWLAPLAATAAAVTVWMVVPQDPLRAPASTVPQSDAVQAPSAPPPSQLPAPAPSAVAEAPAKQVAPTAADARVAEARGDVAGKDTEGKAKLADAQSNKADAGVRERQDKREARFERAEPPTRAEAAAPSAPPAPAAVAAPAEPARDTAAAGAQLGAVSQLRKQVAPLEFGSPDMSSRWRVLPGAVEFSQDGGRTWLPVTISSGGSLVAGSSPLPRVCWIVGRRGLVLLTTDGTNFTRLPFPEAVDILSVSAADGRTAVVATVDGRTFRTDDSGQNWRNP
jgi:hypothetical protein